jgi:hypothetical protein
MSHGAKSLYVALKRHYNTRMENAVYLSTRVAAKELGSNRNAVCSWFAELQHYGFLVMTMPGHLGVEGKGQAPHFRLTEEDHAGQPPTREFLRWDGTKYRRLKKQNPGSESGTTLAPKVVPPWPLKRYHPPERW